MQKRFSLQRRSFQAALLIILTVATKVIAQGGGFINGSFEIPVLGSNSTTLWLPQGSSLLTGWTIGGTGGPVLLADSWPGGYPSFQGNQWLVFNAGDTAPGSTISQSFQTVVGQNYEVSFAVGSDGVGNLSLTASALASDGTVLGTGAYAAPDGSWEVFDLNFVATTTNSTLTFLDSSASTDGGDATLDDIAVTATNAPPPPPPPPPPVAVGGFVNGSFEIPVLGSNNTTLWLPQGSSLLTGWTIGGTGGPVLLADSWPGGYPSFQGNQWLVFNAGDTAPGSTISQTFQTVVGQNYEVSFAVGSDGVGNLSLTASALTSDGTVLGTGTYAPPDGSWEVFDLNFVATTTNSTLTFLDTSASTDGGDATLDDITVTATNAPPPPPPPPPPVAVGGFINGSFEIPVLGSNNTTLWLPQGSSLLTGWTIGGTGGPVLLADSWPGGYSSYQGNQWLVFNAGNTAPGSTLSQSFQTVVGQNYEVSFAVGNDGVGNVSLTASALASDGTVLGTGTCAPPVGSWDVFDLNFVATTTNSTLTFLDTSASTDGGDATLDDITVTATNAMTSGGPALISVRIVHAVVFPALNINQSGANVVLSWSTGSSEFTLEFTPVLGGNWSAVSAPRATNGSTVTLTAPMMPDGGFFRLNLR